MKFKTNDNLKSFNDIHACLRRKLHTNTGEPVTLDGVPARSIPGLDTLDDETMESLPMIHWDREN